MKNIKFLLFFVVNKDIIIMVIVMKDEKVVKKIKEVIENIRPYLQNDGGDVKFNRYENGVVYVSMVGACSNCAIASVTLEDGIEAALINEVPEVIKVVNED